MKNFPKTAVILLVIIALCGVALNYNWSRNNIAKLQEKQFIVIDIYANDSIQTQDISVENLFEVINHLMVNESPNLYCHIRANQIWFTVHDPSTNRVDLESKFYYNYLSDVNVRREFISDLMEWLKIINAHGKE